MAADRAGAVHPAKAARRRFCPGCGERISRSARRCHSCWRVALPWKYYAALSLLLGVLAALAWLGLVRLP